MSHSTHYTHLGSIYIWHEIVVLRIGCDVNCWSIHNFWASGPGNCLCPSLLKSNQPQAWTCLLLTEQRQPDHIQFGRQQESFTPEREEAQHPQPSPVKAAMNSRGSGVRSNSTLPQTKICQFKLVLLGDMAVGKSSLVLRFVKGQFDEFQETTIGGEKRAYGRVCVIEPVKWMSFCLCSGLPGSVGVSGRHHSQVWDLGHCGTRAIPQSGSHVLPRCSGCHCCFWHHQAGTVQSLSVLLFIRAARCNVKKKKKNS